MASRRLLVLNVVLGIVSVALAVGIVRTLIVKRPLPPPAPPRAAAAPPAAAASARRGSGPGAYTVIAARNLFNPRPQRDGDGRGGSRQQAHPPRRGDQTAPRAGPSSRIPRSSACPATPWATRLAVARIQKITDDRVVIARPEGLLEVLLQDPSKPRPTPASSAAPARAAGPTRTGQAAQPPPAAVATGPPGRPGGSRDTSSASAAHAALGPARPMSG